MNKIKTYFEIEAGAVVVKQIGNDLKFLILHRIKMKDKTLPSGHVEKNESLEDAAKREVFEETGYKIEIGEFIDSIEYKVKEKHNGKEAFFIRRIYFFLGKQKEAQKKFRNPDKKEGDTKSEWVSYDEALQKLKYDTDKNLVRKIYCKKTTDFTKHLNLIRNEVSTRIKKDAILNKGILKFGITGSVNDGEFSPEWSDVDFIFILKSNRFGNIRRSLLLKLRKINSEISLKYPAADISFLTHTYNDLEKYVSFEYLNHYKFSKFFIQNDSVNFASYIKKIVKNRKINAEIKQRYAVYHLRHFRFNLIRKVVSTPDNKKALKLILDKLIEVMILYLSYNSLSIKGKLSRLKKIKEINTESKAVSIFEKSLNMRENWRNINNVNNKEIGAWLNNFEYVLNIILKHNLYSVPEELINNKS